MIEKQNNPWERGFVFGTFEEIFKASPHECTCHACNFPLLVDCYNCGNNCWKLTLFGRHLQLECRCCRKCMCINTEVTSSSISNYLLSGNDEESEEEEKRYMTKTVSEKEVLQALAEIRHPEIDHNLVDLEMVKDVAIQDDKVTLSLMLPFPAVPIRNYLMHIVIEALNKLGKKIEIKPGIMSQEEREKFFKMARKAQHNDILKGLYRT